MPNWTREQQRVIDARDRNLLVSAGAGAGKTAVLVERMIKRIMDKENPVDIDSILVVTFTKAAAGEMKARLGTIFEKALKDNPGDKHLIRQIGLVENAQISTIDSFCTKVLKNYYNAIDLEPDFRTAEDGELNLIKEDVLNALLEEKFAEKNPDFLAFVVAFSPGKNFKNVSQLVFDLHRFSQSKPWPLEWLDECGKVFEITDAKEYAELPLVKEIVEYVKSCIVSACKDYDYMIDCCNELDGPYEYIPLLEQEKEFMEIMMDAENLTDLQRLSSVEYAGLPKSPKSDEDIRKEIQKLRNATKARITKLGKSFCVDIDTQLNELLLCRPMARVYLGLTKEFIERFQQYKKEKNIV